MVILPEMIMVKAAFDIFRRAVFVRIPYLFKIILKYYICDKCFFLTGNAGKSVIVRNIERANPALL